MGIEEVGRNARVRRGVAGDGLTSGAAPELARAAPAGQRTFRRPGGFLDFRFGRRAILFDSGPRPPLRLRAPAGEPRLRLAHPHGPFRRVRPALSGVPASADAAAPRRTRGLRRSGRASDAELHLEPRWRPLGRFLPLRVDEFSQGRIRRTARFSARQRLRSRGRPARLARRRRAAGGGVRVEAVELDHGSLPRLRLRELRAGQCLAWRPRSAGPAGRPVARGSQGGGSPRSAGKTRIAVGDGLEP